MLTFDDAKHEYRWNGLVVPGVTSVISPLQDFSRVPADILSAAQERGAYVHRMTELYDLGELDEAAMLASPAHAIYHGYLRAWKAFLAEYDAVWDEIEKMGYSRRYGFAGTWDRAGKLMEKLPGDWTIDIKTAKLDSDTWGIQTAAYRQIRSEGGDIRAALSRRATVQLDVSGDFTFIPWDATDDMDCFLALLTIHQWKAKR